MKRSRSLSRARCKARRSLFLASTRLLEELECRMLLSATVDPIAAQTVSDTNPLYVPVTGSTDEAGLTYTVSSSNPSVTATVVTVTSWLELNVAGFGVMDFALFGNLAPLTVAHITSLVNSGFYNGLDIFRVYPDFMMQMGSPNNDGTGGSTLGTVADEFTGAYFEGNGQLAMANSGTANSGDSQFFITQGAQTELNQQYTLFGQLVRGFDVQTAIMAVPLTTGNSVDNPTPTRPVTPVVITSASIITDTTDAVIEIIAGANQSAEITVTANDGHGDTSSQSFALTGPAPYINPIANLTMEHDTTLDIPITVTNPGDVTFSYLAATEPVLNGSASGFTNSNTNYHFVPDPGYVGDITVELGLIVNGTPHTTSFTVNVVDTPPTLTTISEIPGASQDTDFTISYATLLAASNLADTDPTDVLSFQIETVTNGTLTENGVPVVGGTTLLGAGESLVWHSNAGDAGDLPTFTVEGYDGYQTLGTPVSVVIQTAEVPHAPTMSAINTLSGGNLNQAVSITGSEILNASNAVEIDTYDPPLSFIVMAVNSGTLTFNGDPVVPGTTIIGPTDTVVWTPDSDAMGILNAFDVEAINADLLTSGSAVTVKVGVGLPTLTTITTLTGAVQDAPYSIPFDTLLNASDATNPNGPVEFRIDSILSGTLTLNGDEVLAGTLFSEGETLVWQAAAGASGTLDAFTVLSTDGTNDSVAPVTVTVQVTPLPTLTTIATLTGAAENAPFTISYDTLLAASDLSDVNSGATLSFLIEDVSSGTLTENGNPVVGGTTTIGEGDSVVWTPDTDASGTLAAFTVVGYDGTLQSATPVTVSVEVTPNIAIAPLPADMPTVIPTGKTLFIPVAGTTADGSGVTYTVTTSDPGVTATVLTGNTFLTMVIQYTDSNGDLTTGTMVLELFNDFAPITAGRITSLVNANFYNGTDFFRVIADFVMQGGDPTNTGTGGSGYPFDDEFNANAIFSGSGQLAMANSGADTNDSQFFITQGAARYLDFDYTLFGQLVRGFDVEDAILSTPVDSNDKPTNTVTLLSATMTTDTQDAVVMLKDTGGVADPSVTVTITGTDGSGDTTQQVLDMSVPASDSYNDPPFLGALPDTQVLENSSVKITLPYTDIGSGAVQFAMGSLTNATGSITNGVLTITPTAGFTGTITVFVGVASTYDLTTVVDSETLSDGNSYPLHARGSRESSYPTGLPPENQTVLYDTQFFTVTVVRGNVDVATASTVSGWAWSNAAGSSAVNVRVDIDGIAGTPFAASLTRNDLQPAVGSPDHGFSFVMPDLSPGVHTISVYEIGATGCRCSSGRGPLRVPRTTPPNGYIDTASASGVSGWAFDPSGGANAVVVQVYVDGVYKIGGTANLTRNDLTKVVGSPDHGFSLSWAGLSAGTHTIKVYLFNYGYNMPVLLGTATVTNHAPIGYVDMANAAQVSGWALDPDSPATSIDIRVDIDGVQGTPFAASVTRNDVKAIYGSANHGFSYAYPALPLAPGFHRIDVWAVDANTGALTLLGSRTVNANTPPRGYVDSLTATAVSGWAYDADAGASPINIRVFVDGIQRPDAVANVYRSDLIAAVGSANHGFSYALPQLTVGTHTVSVYAIDPQNASLVLLKSGSVTVAAKASDPPPTGYIDTFTSTQVSGWAFATQAGASPVFVRVDVDGTTVVDPTAATNVRNDLTKVVGSPDHGYSFALNLTANASHVVDVYYIDPQTSVPVLMASKLFGTAAPIGWVDVLNATTISGWALDTSDGPNPIEIRVDVDGQAGATFIASDTRNDLTKPYGSPNHGFTIAAPWLAPGVHTIVVRAINPYTLATVVIGTATVTYT